VAAHFLAARINFYALDLLKQSMDVNIRNSVTFADNYIIISGNCIITASGGADSL